MTEKHYARITLVDTTCRGRETLQSRLSRRLVGQTESSLNLIAREIQSTGGIASVAKLDALSPESVETHLREVVTKAGKLDISFNLIGTNVEIGTRLTELSEQRFADAAFKRVRSYFITMTAAAA